MNTDLKNKWENAFKKLHVRIRCNSYEQKSSALQRMGRITGLPVSDVVMESIIKRILLMEFPYVGVDNLRTTVTAFHVKADAEKYVTYTQFMNCLRNETCPFDADPPKPKTFQADNLPVVEFYYTSFNSHYHLRTVKLQRLDDQYLTGLEVLLDGKHQYKKFSREYVSQLKLISFNPNAHTPDKKD